MPTSDSIAPNLLNIIDSIEHDKKETASLWIEIESVKRVFKSHKISTVKFKNSYGIPIIEYFIAVVREEKELGNCPIMSKLVHFLLEKNITPQNVFDICMGLRKTLVASLFKKGLVEENALEILEELATLFDANLSGVLEIFTSYYAHKQEKIEKSVIQQKKFNQTLKIINFINTKIIIAQSGRIIMGNRSFFETVGVKNLKELYQKREQNLSFMKGTDCQDESFSSEDIEEWLAKVSDLNKPFKTDIYHHKLKNSYTYSGRVTTLPQTEPKQYIISLNSISDHLEDETDIKNRLEHDQLSGLINYAKFINLVGIKQREAQAQNLQLAMIIVDIPMLKEINKDKGMEAGNQVIIEVAQSIREFSNVDMIYARLEGSRFGILSSYSSEQEVYEKCLTLSLELERLPERKTLSLTAFDLSDSVHNTIMRGNMLVDSLYLQDNNVVTDFENIELHEYLSNQESFTKRLKEVHKVRTTMYYNELAVVANNEIVYIEKERVVIALSHKEFNIAELDKSIYLDLPNLGTLKASIYSIDEQKMRVTLHRFILKKETPLQRKKIRVEAQENIKATILSDGLIISARLIDVNEHCLAVELKRRRNLLEGASISVDITLPIEEKLEYFTSEATIENIQKIKDYYKIVLLCHFDSVNKSILQNYIAHRQMQIIHKLNEKNSLDDYSI